MPSTRAASRRILRPEGAECSFRGRISLANAGFEIWPDENSRAKRVS